MSEVKKLYRLPSEGQIVGVAAGLAKYLELDVTLVRLVLVLLAFVSGGFVIILYFAAAFILPTPGKEYPSGDNFGASVSQNAQTLSKELENNKKAGKLRNFFGIGLVLIGGWLLLERLFPDTLAFRWDVVWPALLVIAGLLIVTKRRG